MFFKLIKNILIASFVILPCLSYADVWQFNKDGSITVHEKQNYVKRASKLSLKSQPLVELRKKYDPIIKKEAFKYSIDPYFVHALIEKESGYRPKVVSHKGAVGLMQLIPQTAKRFNVKDSTDPRDNIRGGVQYLAYLFTLFDQPEYVLAAYNAGEHRVAPCIDQILKDNCKRLPPKMPNFKETKAYVRNVLSAYHKLKNTKNQI